MYDVYCDGRRESFRTLSDADNRAMTVSTNSTLRYKFITVEDHMGGVVHAIFHNGQKFTPNHGVCE